MQPKETSWMKCQEESVRGAVLKSCWETRDFCNWEPLSQGGEMLITTPGITEQGDTSFTVSGTDQQKAKNLVLVQNIKVSHHYPKNGNQIYIITFFKKVWANSEMANRVGVQTRFLLLQCPMIDRYHLSAYSDTKRENILKSKEYTSSSVLRH